MFFRVSYKTFIVTFLKRYTPLHGGSIGRKYDLVTRTSMGDHSKIRVPQDKQNYQVEDAKEQIIS